MLSRVRDLTVQISHCLAASSGWRLNQGRRYASWQNCCTPASSWWPRSEDHQSCPSIGAFRFLLTSNRSEVLRFLEFNFLTFWSRLQTLLKLPGIFGFHAGAALKSGLILSFCGAHSLGLLTFRAPLLFRSFILTSNFRARILCALHRTQVSIGVLRYGHRLLFTSQSKTYSYFPLINQFQLACLWF